MAVKNRKNAAAAAAEGCEEDEEVVAPFRHRYPTRWSLRAFKSPSSPVVIKKKVPRVEDKAKDQVFVACKRRKKERHILHLPREIIFDILLLIPAKLLHEAVRYLCKQLYDIVSDPCFKSKLCPPSLLIQGPGKLNQINYIEAHTGGLTVTEIQIPFPATLLGSFNGNVLLRDIADPKIFLVMNPMTKAKMSLPPIVGRGEDKRMACFALGSSGRYKVVQISLGFYIDDPVQMTVFTVGVDKAWRCIDLQGLQIITSLENTLARQPYVIAGFIYWCGLRCCGFAMDVDTETIYEFASPRDFTLNGWANFFFDMGTCLGSITQDGDGWMFWKLTDIKSGVWTKIAGIDDKLLKSRVNRMFDTSDLGYILPMRFVNDDFWFYRRVGEEFVVFRYNRANESIVYLPLKLSRRNDLFYPHVRRVVFHPHVPTLLSPYDC